MINRIKYIQLNKLFLLMSFLTITTTVKSQDLVVEVDLIRLFVQNYTGQRPNVRNDHRFEFKVILLERLEKDVYDSEIELFAPTTNNHYRAILSNDEEGQGIGHWRYVESFNGGPPFNYSSEYPLSYPSNNLVGQPEDYYLFRKIVPYNNEKYYRLKIEFIYKEDDRILGDDTDGKFLCGSIDDGVEYPSIDYIELDPTLCDNGIVNDDRYVKGCEIDGHGSYDVALSYYVNSVALPNDIVICQSDFDVTGVVLSEWFQKQVNGFDGDLHTYDLMDNVVLHNDHIYGHNVFPQSNNDGKYFDENHDDEDHDDIYEFFCNRYTPYFIWKQGNTTIQNSYTGVGMSSVGPTVSPGTYQLYTGYYHQVLKKDNSGNVVFQYLATPVQNEIVREVTLHSQQNTIIDHINPSTSQNPAYFICPGGLITLGDNTSGSYYNPRVDHPETVVHLAPQDLPGTENDVLPSPNEFDDGLPFDGITYFWEDDNGVCLGRAGTLDIIKTGTYSLTITHHYFDPYIKEYFDCEWKEDFYVAASEGPDINLPPYIALCDQNFVNNTNYIELSAFACPNPQNTTCNNGFSFEWSPVLMDQGPLIVPGKFRVNTPGIYTVKVTNTASGCFTIKQIEVTACNEINYDKIIPFSLVNRLENKDDINGAKEIIATANLQVNDFNTDCSGDDFIERQALVKLNYHRGEQSDLVGVDDFALEINYTLSGANNTSIAGNHTLIVNNFGSTPTYLAVNKYNLDQCDVNLALNITSVIVHDGPVGNTNTQTTTSTDLIPEDIHLELEQIIYRLQKLSTVQPELQDIENVDVNQKTSIEWLPVDGAIEYELMIAFEDDFMDDGLKLSDGTNFVNEDAFFKNYGYKIETNKTSYTLDATYPEGILFFKVRAIGRHIEANNFDFSYRKVGPWSDKKELLFGDGFVANVNLEPTSWQKTITFAEDGKHKEVVSYFDDFMRTQGVVTSLNSDETILRAHSFYDYEGRSVLQTLPFAEVGTSLQFQAHEYEVEIDNAPNEVLEKSQFDFGVQPKLANTYGSAEYYSAANSIQNNSNLTNRFPNMNYIPNADGYVTTQVAFKNDGSGRVTRQSGIGETYRLRELNTPNHETKYIYATATSFELRRLFGSNVGFADHYKKQMVVDPNGQVSVSYLDMQNRVIATALAGNTPENLVSLDSEREMVVEPLDDKNLWVPAKKAFIITQDIPNAIPDSRFIFNYDIETVVNSLSFLFPGREEIYSQDYYLEENIEDPSWANNNDWAVNNGNAIVYNGLLQFSNSGNFSGDLQAVITLDLDITTSIDYTLIAQFRALDEVANVSISLNNGQNWTPIEYENDYLFHSFTTSGHQPKLKIDFPDLENVGQLGSIDFIKVYEKSIIPLVQSSLNFELDLTDDGNDETTVVWSGHDAAGISTPSNQSVAEFFEIKNDGDGNGDSDFESVLSITIPHDQYNTTNPRTFEVLFNASYFDPSNNPTFRIDDKPATEIKVLNCESFVIPETSTEQTVNFTFSASNIIHDIPSFKKKVLDLNYFKIYEVSEETNPRVFKNCDACEYELTTYILDEQGNKVVLELNLSNVTDPREIKATILKDGFVFQDIEPIEPIDCQGINPLFSIEDNIFDISIGSQMFNNKNNFIPNTYVACNNCLSIDIPLNPDATDGYFVDVTSDITVHSSINAVVVSPNTNTRIVTVSGGEYIINESAIEGLIYGTSAFNATDNTITMSVDDDFLHIRIEAPSEDILSVNFTVSTSSGFDLTSEISPMPEIRFRTTFADIANYTLYKELKVLDGGLEVFLKQQKEIAREGFIYNFIKEQIEITDLDAICAFTCDDACAAQIVANINVDQGLDILDPDRLKVADFKVILENTADPLHAQYQLLYTNCLSDNFCNPEELFSEQISNMSAEFACESLLGQMKSQITNPDSYYGNSPDDEDYSDDDRAVDYYHFLYKDFENVNIVYVLEDIDEATIDDARDRILEIKTWVDNIVDILGETDFTNIFSLDNLDLDAKKGQFISKHWNGQFSTEEVLELEGYPNHHTLLNRFNFNPDWEALYVYFHREYPHYEFCKLDAEGRAFLIKMKAEVNNWEEARISGYLYPMSGAARTIETGYDGVARTTIAANSDHVDPFIENYLLEDRMMEKKFYLESFERYREPIADGYSPINLWQFLDESGDYACLHYANDENNPYVIGEFDPLPIYPDGCNPSGFIAHSPSVLGKLKWEKFVNLYTGQREQLKIEVFLENYNGHYFEDEFAINVKALNGPEAQELLEDNDLLPGLCADQCDINVQTWIEGLKNFCEAEAIDEIDAGSLTEQQALIDIEVNNAIIDNLADEFSLLCLDNCMYGLGTAMLTQVVLEPNGALTAILSNTAITYITDAMVDYSSLTDEDEKADHFLEQLFVIRISTADISQAANCDGTGGTCDLNAIQWINDINTGYNCVISPAEELVLKPILVDLCLSRCGAQNPLGWLSAGDQQYIAEALLQLSCFNHLSVEDLLGNNDLNGEIEDNDVIDDYGGVVGNVFIEDGIQVVYDNSGEFTTICQPSECIEDLVASFWEEGLGEVTSYTSENCSFDYVNFEGDYVTLVDNMDCEVGDRCFTTLYWVNRQGNRIHLPINSPQIVNETYTDFTPIVPEVSELPITAQFANYTAQLVPLLDGVTPTTVIADSYCKHTSEESNEFVLTDGLEVPYITQLLDENNEPLENGLNEDILTGDVKYYLYPVNPALGEKTIADLNVILKQTFNSQRTNVIAFERHTNSIPRNVGDNYDFNCVEALLLSPEVSYSEKKQLKICIANSLFDLGTYSEEDYATCLGNLSSSESYICNDRTTSYSYSYTFKLFDVPSTFTLSNIYGHFGNGEVNLAIGTGTECHVQPVVEESCITVCDHESNLSNYAEAQQPYITQIYTDNNEQLLSGQTNYYLSGTSSMLNQLSTILSNKLGPNVEVELVKDCRSNNGCNGCPGPEEPTCTCLGFSDIIQPFQNYKARKFVFSGGGFPILFNSYQLVNYNNSTGGFTLNNAAIATMEADFSSHLNAAITFDVTLNENLAQHTAFLSVKAINLPSGITAIGSHLNQGNFRQWDVISETCDDCYAPADIPNNARIAQDCADYLKVLKTFKIAVDTSDCDAISNRYSEFNASISNVECAYKIVIKNVPSTIGSFTINFNNGVDQVLHTTLTGDCSITDVCFQEGDDLFLYSISFDHLGQPCGNEIEENCIEVPQLVGVMNPNGGIPDVFYTPDEEELLIDCQQQWQSTVIAAAQNAFEDEWSDLEIAIEDAAINACKNVEEDYNYQHILDEHHYTLYYYDNSGALLQTIPPEGAIPLSAASFDNNGHWNGDEPPHYLRTRYRYNSRNQVVWQNTPDAGESNFYYNRIGQLILSQDAEQFDEDDLIDPDDDLEYSFTQYDEHGRIKWVGEINLSMYPEPDFDSLGSTLRGLNYFEDVYDLTTYLAANPTFAASHPELDPTIPGFVPPTAEELFRIVALENTNFPIDDDELQLCLQDITYTVYDNAVFIPGLAQENLRNRVSASYRFDNYAEYETLQSSGLDHINFTAYSYDEIGNVKALVQHVASAPKFGEYPPDMDAVEGSLSKRIDYQYDLVSGNVNKVIYQKGKADQFTHRYEYDADNRITDVYTTKDGVIEQLEAEYFYYPHGPLARVEVGEDKVQAQDYYYTLQGWLKGVNGNGTDNTDPGKDGEGASINSLIARDEFAFQLGYFDGDYAPINAGLATINKTDNNWAAANGVNDHWEMKHASVNGLGYDNAINEANNYNGLYNGNIGMMISHIPQFGDNATLISNYRYDQLNRIKGAVGINETDDALTYQTAYNFDAMGNLTKLYRSGIKDDILTQMDDFEYHYNYSPDNANNPTARLRDNQLRHVNDNIAAGNFDVDIDDQSVNYNASFSPTVINDQFDNYTYDNIGNLLSDFTEQIAEIKWDVYGKIAEIIRDDGSNTNRPASTQSDLAFEYDAAGNRVTKIVKPRVLNSNNISELVDEAKWHYTHYIRDAQGNILATYEEEHDDASVNPFPEERRFTLEHNIYGSSRLGIFKDIAYNPVNYSLPTANLGPDKFNWVKGFKYYESSNHLGNVMVTYSDLKRGNLVNHSIVDEYDFSAEIETNNIALSNWELLGLPSETALTITTDNKLEVVTTNQYKGAKLVFDNLVVDQEYRLECDLEMGNATQIGIVIATVANGSWLYDDLNITSDLHFDHSFVVPNNGNEFYVVVNRRNTNTNGGNTFKVSNVKLHKKISDDEDANDWEAYPNTSAVELSTSFEEKLKVIPLGRYYGTFVKFDNLKPNTEYKIEADLDLGSTTQLGLGLFKSNDFNNAAELLYSDLSIVTNQNFEYTFTMPESETELYFLVNVRHNINLGMAFYLDNVRLTETEVPDEESVTYFASVQSAQDYYPYGMLLQNRSYSKPPCATIQEEINGKFVEDSFEGAKASQHKNSWTTFSGVLNTSTDSNKLTIEVDSSDLDANGNYNTAIVRQFSIVNGSSYTIEFDLAIEDSASITQNSLSFYCGKSILDSAGNILDFIAVNEIFVGHNSITITPDQVGYAGFGVVTTSNDHSEIGMKYSIDNFTVDGNHYVYRQDCNGTIGNNLLASDYRFGFQGQEKDSEVSGTEGGHLAFRYRFHDVRLGKFLSVDPLSKSYPWNSSYAFAENKVMEGVDLEGTEYLSNEEARVKIRRGEIYLNVPNLSVPFQTALRADGGFGLEYKDHQGNIISGSGHIGHAFKFDPLKIPKGKTGAWGYSGDKVPIGVGKDKWHGKTISGVNMPNTAMRPGAVKGGKGALGITILNELLAYYINKSFFKDQKMILEQVNPTYEYYGAKVTAVSKSPLKLGIEAVDKAYEEGFIPDDYYTIEAKSALVNVVLYGETGNGTGDNDIYRLGLKIADKAGVYRPIYRAPDVIQLLGGGVITFWSEWTHEIPIEERVDPTLTKYLQAQAAKAASDSVED